MGPLNLIFLIDIVTQVDILHCNLDLWAVKWTLLHVMT